jgi:hypothetical protein
MLQATHTLGRLLGMVGIVAQPAEAKKQLTGAHVTRLLDYHAIGLLAQINFAESISP